VPDGEDVGRPLVLRDWQQDIIVQIYANLHGTRQAVISFAKKNAKTTLVACLLLLHLVGPEARRNTQLPSTAQTKEQAAVLFELAAKMVRMHPVLSRWVIIRDTNKEMVCPRLGTKYMALSADAKTAHGKSPVFAVHDELGQVRGPTSELYNAVENAMGAHKEPLSIIISTQAPTDNDLLSIRLDDALSGKDPRKVGILYTADPELDPFSEEALRQANPAYGDFLNADELHTQAEDARRMPLDEPLYRNYTLNQRVQATSPFVSATVWKENGGPIEKWGEVAFGGLDLSETTDLTAFLLVSPNEDGVLNVRPTFWLPHEGLEQRAKADHQKYDVWASQGYLETTPGHSVQYKYIAKHLVEVIRRQNVRKIAFDRWGMNHLLPLIEDAGLSKAECEEIFVPFGQGTQSMHPALQVLKAEMLAGNVRHEMHPVLTMCAQNAVAEKNPAGWMKLTKAKSYGRIDGMVALAMAMDLASKEMHAAPAIPIELDTILEDMDLGGNSAEVQSHA